MSELTETIEIPLGANKQVVTFHGRVKITWPSPRPNRPALLAGDLLIHDVDTGEDVGLTTLALLAIRAGDAAQGATGYLRACLLRISDAEGVPVSDRQPVFAPANLDPEQLAELKQRGVGVMNDMYVAECWYAVAEMEIGEPLPSIPDDEDAVIEPIAIDLDENGNLPVELMRG